MESGVPEITNGKPTEKWKPILKRIKRKNTVNVQRPAFRLYTFRT